MKQLMSLYIFTHLQGVRSDSHIWIRGLEWLLLSVFDRWFSQFSHLAFFIGAYGRQKLRILAYLIVSEGVFGFLEESMHSLLYEMYMSNGGPGHMDGPADARSGESGNSCIGISVLAKGIVLRRRDVGGRLFIKDSF